MKKSLQELVRPNIWKLKPYSSARDEYNGTTASVFLDANENPYNNPHNRYPDPLQRDLKVHLSQIKKVPAENIFLGNGSDEAIDLVFRAFCEPRIDNVVAIDPTYGMYQVCAEVNDVEYRKVLLDEHFQFTADRLLAVSDEHTKLMFLCSPKHVPQVRPSYRVRQTERGRWHRRWHPDGGHRPTKGLRRTVHRCRRCHQSAHRGNFPSDAPCTIAK